MMQAAFRGWGVIVNDKLHEVSFQEQYDAEEYVKGFISHKNFRDGVNIRFVRTIITLAEDQS